MKLKLFDSHAHYDDDAFDSDRELLLLRLPEKGVAAIINPGCSVESSKKAVELAKNYDYIYAAAAVHPGEARDITEDDIKAIGDLAAQNHAVAIGEIGLDYHYEDVPKEIQLKWFDAQLKLALELDLPVIIHDRDAHSDTMNLLKKYKPRGVLHCFSGSAEMAGELVKMGFYIGFTGVVTFKNAKRAISAVESIPLERILIETDSPYMAPEPFRGRRCDSSMVEYTLRRIAEIKGIEPQIAAEKIYQNTKEAFSID